MERLIAQDAILRVIYQVTYAQDQLDRQGMLEHFLPDRTFTFDMADLHKGSSARDITPSELFDFVYGALAGFSATQHLLTAPVFEFPKEDTSIAHLKLSIQAFHCIDADGSIETLTNRAHYELDFEQHHGKWMIRKWVVQPTVPLNPTLYETARQRAEKGLVRQAK